MQVFKLSIRNGLPVQFEGEELTTHEQRSDGFYEWAVRVYRTKRGNVLLYVGILGTVGNSKRIQRIYQDADKMTAQEVIDACEGELCSAKKALEALGLPSVNYIY